MRKSPRLISQPHDGYRATSLSRRVAEPECLNIRIADTGIDPWPPHPESALGAHVGLYRVTTWPAAAGRDSCQLIHALPRQAQVPSQIAVRGMAFLLEYFDQSSVTFRGHRCDMLT